MCDDNKRAKNSYGGDNNPNASDGSDRSKQGHGGNNQNQGNQGNQGGGYQGNQGGGYQGNGGGRGKQRGGYNPNSNQNQGRGSGGRGNRYNPPQGNFPPFSSSLSQDQGKNLRFDDVAAIFDNDIHNLMDSHVEEQPHVIVREEFLHNPSTLPSHHLNVTVIVQDKGRTDPASELRAVGKAVLHTANYSEDFFFFTMLEKLNATHLYYPALQAITVCSGLNGQCYLNNEICDLKILFNSYDGECQSISLPMRVNRKTEIEILFSRKTVNKYDFWSLTLSAFGISPKLSAENKRKSDARKRDFDKKEALLKLDPMYQHKYTRRMIALGAEPDTAEVESITPHYDKLKVSRR